MLIGETADGAAAGVDNGKPQIAAVEPDRRHDAAHTAARIDDVDRGRMCVLIVLGVVSVMQADRLRRRVDFGVGAAEENRGVADSDYSDRYVPPASRARYRGRPSD